MKDISKLYYDVIRKYQLPVVNHTVIKRKIKAMEQEVGNTHAAAYLETLLWRDLRDEAAEFQPTLNTGLDIYAKRVQLEKYFARTAPPKTWTRPSLKEAQEAEEKRKSQWED